jgi:hypothetical protein
MLQKAPSGHKKQRFVGLPGMSDLVIFPKAKIHTLLFVANHGFSGP